MSLFFSILIAFCTFSSLKSLRLTGGMDSGSFAWVGFVGFSQLSTSQKCSAYLTSFFSPSDRKVPFLALTGQGIEEGVQVTLGNVVHYPYVVMGCCFFYCLCLLIQPLPFVTLSTDLDFFVFLHIFMIFCCFV